jgi:carbamoyltransferase
MKFGQYVVLGIYEGHMSSAVLMIDGEVIASGHEERFTKLKMDVGLPVKSARFCLDYAGVAPDEIDVVAVVGLTLDPRDHLTKRYAKFSVEDYVFENENYWYPRLIEGRTDLNYFDVMGRDRISPDHYWDVTNLNLDGKTKEIANAFNEIRYAAIEQHLDISRAKVQLLPHYLCHHYHAYYSGSVRGEDVVIVHNEAIGDGYNAVVSMPTANGLSMICGNAETDLGRLYKWITLLLGMKPHQHEYKLMGLAPYSNSYEQAKAAKVFDPLFKVDHDEMLIKYNERPGDLYFHFRDQLKSCRFDGIAAALQSMVERLLAEWIEVVLAKTGKKRVCYAGGVAMNVKANKIISEIEILDDLFVPISPADETTHIGAAYWATESYFLLKGKDPNHLIPPLTTAYFGPPLDQSKVSDKLTTMVRKHGYKVTEFPELSTVADLLADGKVLARCRGRSELGQRSLGNRSILAHPGTDGIIDKINNQIKYRDFWMPFCPTILKEDENKYLKNNKHISSKFMTISFDSNPESSKEIAGGIHPADKTARPQILDRSFNPDYHDLITAFKNKTGIGCLMNTSFNLHGDPMVEDGEDAFRTFEYSDLDALWLGDYLVCR